MGETIIGWATHTNNVVTGCSKPAAVPPEALRYITEQFDLKWTKPGTSPECFHCYAEFLSTRRGWTEKPWQLKHAEENVRLRPERFREFDRFPIREGRPSQSTRIFVCSMGDVFHHLVPDSFLHELFEVMVSTGHICMLLTKEIARASAWPGPWTDKIWLGTTCGHPMTKWRIEYLRRSRAKVRFLSMEPLLASLLPLNLAGIDQAIVGGESGGDFRPMDMAWAREIRDVAAAAGSAFFFKQDSAFRTETRPYLVEPDGRCLSYRQFPGELSEPTVMAPEREHFPVLRSRQFVEP